MLRATVRSGARLDARRSRQRRSYCAPTSAGFPYPVTAALAPALRPGVLRNRRDGPPPSLDSNRPAREWGIGVPVAGGSPVRPTASKACRSRRRPGASATRPAPCATFVSASARPRTLPSSCPTDAAGAGTRPRPAHCGTAGPREPLRRGDRRAAHHMRASSDQRHPRCPRSPACRHPEALAAHARTAQPPHAGGGGRPAPASTSTACSPATAGPAVRTLLARKLWGTGPRMSCPGPSTRAWRWSPATTARSRSTRS